MVHLVKREATIAAASLTTISTREVGNVVRVP